MLYVVWNLVGPGCTVFVRKTTDKIASAGHQSLITKLVHPDVRRAHLATHYLEVKRQLQKWLPQAKSKVVGHSQVAVVTCLQSDIKLVHVHAGAVIVAGGEGRETREDGEVQL